MNCGIYLIRNILTDKCYIGSSKVLKSRKNHHFSELSRGTHRNPYLQAAYTKYGKIAFTFKILEYCHPDSRITKEDYWINYFDSRNPQRGYNLRNADGSEMSDEHKSKISESKKGKKFSDEHRQNLSISHKGKHLPKEQRLKISLSLYGNKRSEGHKHSEETRSKMSEAHKGRKHSEESIAKMVAAQKLRWKNRKSQKLK